MRHRSSRGGAAPPPAPRLVVPGRELTGPDAWPQLFGRRARLVVELGFGKDHFLLDRAEAAPDADHVGVERDPERAAAFVREAERRGLPNVRAMPVSAEIALGQCFGDASVAELHVYFPDPWPKERHARHRLVQPWFPREAHRVLAADGVLRMATDDAPYALQIEDVVVGSGLFRALAEAPADPVRATKFERLWRRKGRVIRDMAFSPIPGASARLRRAWTGSGARGGSPT